MFTEAERKIYTLAGRHFDPLRVRRQLLVSTDGKLNDHLLNRYGTAEQPADVFSPLAMQAEEELVKATRVAFSLPDFDAETGNGATDGQALAVLLQFLEWLEGKE